MTQTLSLGEPDLVVIEENGVSSRYSQRMTEQESKDIKSLLLRLNDEGASREVMTEEISRLRGRPISKSQLDRLRRELGLTNRQNQCLVQPQEVPLDTEPIDASGPMHDLNRPNIRTTEASGNSQSDLLAASATEIREQPKEIIITAEGSYVDLLNAIQTQLEACQHSSPADDVNLTILYFHDKVDPQNQHSVNIRSPVVPTGESNITEEDGNRSAPIKIRLTRRRGPGLAQSEEILELLQNNSMLLASGFRPYYPSDRALRLCQSCRRGRESNREGISRWNHAATILYILRAYEQAFDIYFLIFCYHRHLKQPSQPPTPEFVCAAINCARSASTVSHAFVARSAVRRVREDMLAYYGSELLEVDRTWQVLNQFALKLSGHTSDAFQEDAEGIAYWGAYAMILSQHAAINLHETVLDYFAAYWKETAIEHIYSCTAMRFSILKGLEKACDLIRRSKNRIDKLGRSCTGTQIAQVISCLILRDQLKSHESPATSRSPLQPSNHGPFPCDWFGYTPIIMTFVLLEWAQQPEFASRFTANLQQLANSTTDIILYVADEIRQNLQSDSSYRYFVKFYFRSMRAPGHQHREAVQTVSEDWLFGIAGAMTNSDPGTEDWLQSEPDCAFEGNGIEADEEGNRSSQADIAVDALSIIESIASSSRSLASSSYESFRRLATRLRENVSASLYSRTNGSSGGITSRSSWSFSRTTGLPRVPSMSQSLQSDSRDVAMDL